MQELAYCGPEKQNCIANQTLRDKNCLVPCGGLYADVTDDSLKYDVTKGFMCFYAFFSSDGIAGFHLMHQELSNGVTWRKVKHREYLKKILHDMFPMSGHDERGEEVKAMTARYLRYKMEYVKHLGFNPYKDNLSEYIQFEIKTLPIPIFRYTFGARTTRGSLCLL